MKKFRGGLLKDMRESKQLTLQQLSQILTCSVSLISRWENGERQPGGRNLRRITEFFKVPVSVFFVIFFCLITSPAHAGAIRDAAIRTIVGEASGQGLDGMTAVGEVIRRRGSISGLYGYKAMEHRQEPPWMWRMAAKAWDRSAHTDLTRGATLFENVYKFGFPKSWDRTKVVCVAEIGDHCFFTEK